MDSQNDFQTIFNSLPELDPDFSLPELSVTILTRRDHWKVYCILYRLRKACKVSKGVIRRPNGRFSCEIRIAKEMVTDESYRKGKVWLGTFRTRFQAARALDVGKLFFSRKKRKNYHNPETEAKLLIFKENPGVETMKEMVEYVQELAKLYGENGTVPPSDWRIKRVPRRSRQKKPRLSNCPWSLTMTSLQLHFVYIFPLLFLSKDKLQVFSAKL